MRTFCLPILLLASSAFGADLSRVARDWPMQRHDAGRSRVTDETLTFPLRCLWRYIPAQPPQPAWSEPPPQLQNQMDFDYAPAPVIANGTLYFGSSADDTLRALDAKTGALKWQFTAGGPVRFAPQVVENRLYFAADDGLIYCLQAANGAVVWTFNAAPPPGFASAIGRDIAVGVGEASAPEQYFGNRRMISRWPIRTGVLVQDGLVYAVAGIWPTEGIYVYALNADTGKVVWLNDTAGFGKSMAGVGGGRWSINDAHMGEFDIFGLTPQGALLATRKALIVPQANNAVAQFNLKGLALSSIGDNAVSGTTPFLDGGMHYSINNSRGGPGVMLYGRSLPEESGKRLVQLYGSNLPLPAASPDSHGPWEERPLKKVDAIVSGDKRYVRKAGGLALAANALLVGRRDEIVAEDLTTTQTLWRAPVQGLAREIAVADGRVYVATDTGEISCFAPPSAGSGTTLVHDARAVIQQWRPEQATSAAAAVVTELKRRHADHGVALVLGDQDGAMSRALAAHTALHVLNLAYDAEVVSSLRSRLVQETAWYGSRIHVIHVPDLRRLPFAQYVANAVIVGGAFGGPGAPRTASESGLSGKELYRVLHPYGGVLMCPGLEKADAEALMRECDAYEVASHAQSLQATTEPTPVPIASTVGGSASGGKHIGTTPPLEGIISRDPLLGGVPGGRGGFSDDSRGGFSSFVRGALPGARDWNTQPPTDQRVKWPLRPLWFGGPEAALVRTTGVAAYPPVAARGRYFVMGDACLTAVDAYNSMTLWSRLIPTCAANRYEVDGLTYAISNNMLNVTVDVLHGIQRILEADDRHVYLRLGAGWFQGRGEALFQLDARTGAQRRLYAPYLPPTTNIALSGARAPSAWVVPLDEHATGRVALAQTAAGIALTLAAPARMERDLLWEVCFDFRALDQRYGLYDDGAFALVLTPPGPEGVARCLRVSGARPPAWQLRREETSGWATTTLLLPWPALEQWRGQRPAGFDLAVAGIRLLERKGMVEARRAPLFGDNTARYLNRSWARIILSGLPALNKPPTILAGEISQRPPDWLWPDMHDPLVIQNPGELSLAYQTASRLHPLTGEPGPRVYRSGATSCGFPVYSAHSVIGRTTKTALGFYDFADDSGLRMFPGLAANCAVHIKAQNMTAALGLLIFSDSRSHCTCLIPIRTSMAFAPAERRLQEDWAIFFDRNADAPVRQAAINLGAPGDRRDEQGVLWLGFPRLAVGKAYPREPGSARYVIQSPPISSSIEVPLKVSGLAGFTGYERLNADSTRIEGTDRPWLYTSCFRGVTNLTLTLEPHPSLLATAAQTQPVLDGRLEASFWNTNGFTRVLSFTGTRMALRFDEKHLYIGAYRLPLVDARGQAAAWTSATQGEDAPIYQDDSMEFFLSDKADAAVVHLGVSASGARYDALAQGRDSERAAWNGEWWSKVRADDTEFAVELAIPWATLKAAGLDKTSLALNMQMNQQNRRAEVPVYQLSDRLVSTNQSAIGDSLLSLGPLGRKRCANFTPVGLGQAPVRKPRLFTVRLHFADLREKADVRRVFDVLLQGKRVLNDFDIVQAAGGTRKAIVKEFQHVSATDTLTLEFSATGGPAGVKPTHDTVPLLNGLELVDEAFDQASAKPARETSGGRAEIVSP